MFDVVINVTISELINVVIEVNISETIDVVNENQSAKYLKYNVNWLYVPGSSM